ncbi:MAG: hypothetical protein LBI42_09695 [Chitinispirillales bacterium]|jgi:hypothetical protein|nr:hypothetical protein [Chitinispirillales bacterium]
METIIHPTTYLVMSLVVGISSLVVAFKMEHLHYTLKASLLIASIVLFTIGITPPIIFILSDIFELKPPTMFIYVRMIGIISPFIFHAVDHFFKLEAFGDLIKSSKVDPQRLLEEMRKKEKVKYKALLKNEIEKLTQ